MQDNTLRFIDKLLDTLNAGYVMSELEFNELGKDFTEFSYEDYLNGLKNIDEWRTRNAYLWSKKRAYRCSLVQKVITRKKE